MAKYYKLWEIKQCEFWIHVLIFAAFCSILKLFISDHIAIKQNHKFRNADIQKEIDKQQIQLTVVINVLFSVYVEFFLWKNNL